MPILGAHMSTSGGLIRAFERIREVEGEAMQIFTKNERQWNAPAINDNAAMEFHDAWIDSGRIPLAAHDTYLINLAAIDPVILEKSVRAFAEELKRCATLGIRRLITHPGAHLGRGVEAGVAELARNLDRAFEMSETSGVEVLIETTAGQGTSLGSTFEEIAGMLSLSAHGDRLGVCYDTCHTFAAGYDIRDPEGFEAVFREFDRTIGLERLKFFHLNDSKKDFGSRVDRHEHIGKGKIGLSAFRLLLNDARFQSIPMVIETPKEGGLERDKENLAVLRSLIAA